MARIFIIGNGYDLARRKDTSYENFKEWLIDKYHLSDEYFNNSEINFDILNNTSTYGSSILKLCDGQNENEKIRLDNVVKETKVKEMQLASFCLYWAFNRCFKNWNNFENKLSKISFNNLFDDFIQFNNKNNVRLKPTLGSPVKKEIDILRSTFGNIPELFAEWISSLDTNTKLTKKGFEKEIIKAINKDDIFIIFNYTKTIEEMFNIKDPSNIYHIHGVYDNPASIVVGHNCKCKAKFTNLCDEKDNINELYATLYKNPEKVIKQNEKLWDSIKSLSDVYIYEFGWSCSNVDRDYIKQIVSCLNQKEKNVKLYLNNYKNKGKSKKSKWTKYGMDEQFISYYRESKDKDSIYYGE